MAHAQQRLFVETVSKCLAIQYADTKILEIGSYDVNGSVRAYFPGSNYTGVDLTDGPGVDLVGKGEEVAYPDNSFDISISCECFEHNPNWGQTLKNMHRMTKTGGVILFTCATTGRLEHGTVRTSPRRSPGSQSIGWDYYKNLTERDIRNKIQISEMFSKYFFMTNKESKDLYFVGFKRGDGLILDIDINELRIRCAAAQNELNEKNAASVPFVKSVIVGAIKMPLIAAEILPDRYYQEIAIRYSWYVERMRDGFKKLIKAR